MVGRLTVVAGIALALLVTEANVAASRSNKSSDSGSRRLEDIHIEGEIPVPQVLFITGRDQRRFLDFQHGRYLKSSVEVGQKAVYPSWITLVGLRPHEVRKEPMP